MKANAYAVDHLFLLMGENPLPNAVAAMSLLQPGGKPYLIHTTYTRKQAERLAGVLKTVSHLQPAHLIDLDDNQAEASVIRQRIQAIAKTLAGKVGMNYTGGTKAMSVHAYRALEQVCSQPVFSYLDSNTLEMAIDNDNGVSTRFKVSLPLSLEQLFRLHGLTWRSQLPPLTHPIQLNAAKEFVRLYQMRDWMKAWRRWCNAELHRLGKNQYSRWKTEWELAQLPSLSLEEMPEPFKLVLQQHLGAKANTFSLQIAQKQGFRDITQVCEWLDGIWLEHYVLAQVQQVASQCDVHESGMSFHIQDALTLSSSWDKFEFDVAFLRHYQLFALSCTTTDSRSLCKQKLIEANLRARQLGGAEARVGLVCCHHDPASLRSELEVATRNRKIAVFGRQDLRNLGEKITSWVQQNG